MKKPILFAMLTASAFALDDRPVMGVGQGKVRAAYHHEASTGTFEASGSHRSWSEQGRPGHAPAAHLVPVQVKYGLLRGLDAEVEWGAAAGNADRGDTRGLLPVEVGFKYLEPGAQAGGYANLVLPFAPGDFVADPRTSGVLGGLWIPAWPRFRVAASAQYAFPFDALDQGTFRLRARPELTLNGWLVYLASHYTTPAKDFMNSYSVLVEPGFYFPVTPRAGGELLAQAIVAGANQPAIWGARASAHVRFGR